MAGVLSHCTIGAGTAGRVPEQGVHAGPGGECHGPHAQGLGPARQGHGQSGHDGHRKEHQLHGPAAAGPEGAVGETFPGGGHLSEPRH